MHQYRPRRPASHWSWIAGLAVLCFLARTSSAAVFFVRTAGSDDADGLSPATAFASIAHAAAALRNPGDHVIVGPGTFKEGGISPRSGFAGHPVEFFADTDGTLTGDAAGPVLIMPPAPQTTGFLLAGRHHVSIDGFTVVGAIDAGIQVRADAAAVASSDVTIRNTQTRECVKRGLDITAGGIITVENNVAVGNGSSGISITGVTDAGVTLAVSSNQVIHNGSHGLFVSNAIGGVIKDNQAEDNSESGILIRSSSNVSITGNSTSGNQDGISAGVGSNATDSVSAVAIADNEVEGNAKAGIDVVASDSVTVEQNSVANSGTSGLLIVGDGATAVSIRSNDIESNGADGISVRGAGSLTVSDNTTRANTANGLRVRQSNTVTISDNTIANNRNSGVDAVSTGSVAFKRNAVASNAAVGASIVADADATIRIDLSNNTLQRNAGGGLFIAGASSGSVADNTLNDHPADGIVVRLSTRLSFVRNHIAQSSGGNGLAIGVGTEQSGGSDFVLVGNEVARSAKGGISVFATGAVTASGNTVTHSGDTGLSLRAVGGPVAPMVSNNTIGTSGGHGIFVLGSNSGVVQNNVVFSNGDTGITLRSAPDALVVNNLVYANVHDGFAIGTNEQAAPRAKVLHNTAYANGGWGLRLGTDVAPSPGASVVGNIFQLNRGDMGLGGGIAVARSATCGYVAGFNINVDGYGEGTPRNDYDIVADPLFLNPAGRDRQLGGDAFADDDFRLQQGRGGQTVESPAVDAGAAPIADIGLTGTTARGAALDAGVVDIGYHYGAVADQRITVPTPYMPIFVRQTGRSSNDGLSPEHALASIQNAAQRADAGGTVVVGPGTYAEGDIHPDQNRGRATLFADATGVLTGDAPGAVLVDATGSDTGFILLNACDATVRGFSVTGAMSAGIQVREGSDDVTVRDNVVFSNQRRGIEASGAAGPRLDNNLVYANGTGGIHVEQGTNAEITNNTVYNNHDDGILIGGSGVMSGASVLRNIVAGNGGGVRVQPNSFSGYFTGFNVVPDGFGGNTPRADSDFVPDKSVLLFIDPPGPSGMLGGSGFLDDDFRLQQLAANPAWSIDYGEPDTQVAGSTRSDGLPDLGGADAGYHYPFLDSGPLTRSAPAVVFVRPSGNDRNTGLSAGRAFASIGRALAAVSGDGLIAIGPGTYREQRLLVGVTGRGKGVVVLLGDEGGQLTGDPAGRIIVDAGGHAAPTVAGPALIDGLTLTGARGPGLRVLRGVNAVKLRNSTLCGNTGDGVATSGDAVSLVNNLLCGNGGAGISVRLHGARVATQLLNNTVAANMRQGIVIREAGMSVPRTLAYNNVVSSNGSTGIIAPAVRRTTPATGNNLNTDGYGVRTLPGAGDLDDAPQFVGGAPTTGIGCEDVDSLRVPSDSPVINRGAATAIEIGLGTRSVTATGSRDTGPTDLGYHYRQ